MGRHPRRPRGSQSGAGEIARDFCRLGHVVQMTVDFQNNYCMENSAGQAFNPRMDRPTWHSKFFILTKEQ